MSLPWNFLWDRFCTAMWPLEKKIVFCFGHSFEWGHNFFTLKISHGLKFFFFSLFSFWKLCMVRTSCMHSRSIFLYGIWLPLFFINITFTNFSFSFDVHEVLWTCHKALVLFIDEGGELYHSISKTFAHVTECDRQVRPKRHHPTSSPLGYSLKKIKREIRDLSRSLPHPAANNASLLKERNG